MDGYRAGIAHEMTADAVTFFAVFARFEFALKRGGFLLGALGQSAHANWNDFAAALGAGFFAQMTAAKEAVIFFKNQPRCLKVTGADEVEFQKPADIVNLQQLFEAVRLVRNNLFHGEKAYLNQRDHDLIAASLFVLDSAIGECANVPACTRVPFAFIFAPAGK
jgi:hypothetical protein